MKSADGEDHFVAHLAHTGQSLSGVRPAAGIAAMISFYSNVRAEDCDIQNGGDMLLFQWGTYDWGEGEHFEFDITRQFIGASGEDEDIWQLSLTFKFPPENLLRELADGNRWCHGLDELTAFETFVLNSPACAAVADRVETSPELDFECAG
jgi:hypothetical protein